MKIKVIDNLFIRHNEPDNSKQSIWLLHGFADSGLAYREIFDFPIASHFNLYIVDLPGFGVSPLNPDALTLKEQSALLSGIIANECQDQQEVNIMAHSLGALIGTWVCQNLSSKINYYFSIEGNLTTADSYFSSKPLQYVFNHEFVEAFGKEIFGLATSEDRFRRYYSSFRFASPQGMRNWSASSQEYVANNKCGLDFMALTCQKLYIWGDKDTPADTQKFIQEHNIPNKLYPGVGHWHMIENAEELYADLFQFLSVG